MIAGGVESMSRAPFVMGKSTAAFSRSAEIFDTTIGWRFVNEIMKKQYGVDSMPETAENWQQNSRYYVRARTSLPCDPRKNRKGYGNWASCRGNCAG
ncbi:MAG: hypothetical protein Ct9H300mP28_26540 [Pseudomonadota bacterium]|nr:MAG: hypothetical protein Ct9H300mP28_26540 [Pseudomonadota bacterium]